MIDFVDVLLLGLSAFRVSRFLVIDDGPFLLMKRIREKFESIELLKCIHCAGVYVSGIVYVLYVYNVYWLLIILAISGFVSLVRELVYN